MSTVARVVIAVVVFVVVVDDDEILDWTAIEEDLGSFDLFQWQQY